MLSGKEMLNVMTKNDKWKEPGGNYILGKVQRVV